MRSILVIDDDEIMRETLQDALEEQGFRVISASDGRQGLRKFKAPPVSLVITDIVMPEIDGIGIVRHIKQSAPQIPVIVMSGWRRCGRSFYLDVAKALGADDAIAKPFTIKEMITRIDRCLAA